MATRLSLGIYSSLAVLVTIAVTVNVSNAEPADNLRVMSYNVRYGSDRTPNAWPDRRPVAKIMLDTYQPDVIGMQEALYRQVKDFSSDLPKYGWIGLGRDGGSRGEFMAVFYRTERLVPLQFDHYWLSDTPNVVGSTSWGNSNRRMVTWVRFRDMRTKAEFYFLNTHFDHEIREARVKSAELVRERTSKLADAIPKILVGDFNALAGTSAPYKTLVNKNGFVDTWDSAVRRGEEYHTFHGYRGLRTGAGRRIDWILTQGDIKCVYAEAVIFSQNGQFPSDHLPVIADIELPQAP